MGDQHEIKTCILYINKCIFTFFLKFFDSCRRFTDIVDAGLYLYSLSTSLFISAAPDIEHYLASSLNIHVIKLQLLGTRMDSQLLL